MLTSSDFVQRKHVVNILNRKTYYWEYGNSESNITVILIHGFRGDHHGLELIAKELLEFHLIVPDLPGFGLSEPFLQHHTNAYTQWLHQFLCCLNDKRILVILGHSFGTILVSAAIASGLPVNQVILVNPLAQTMPRYNFLAQLTTFYYWLASKLPERVSQNLLQSKLVVTIMNRVMIKTTNKKTKQWIYQQHYQYFTNVTSKETIFSTFHMMKNCSVSQYANKISTRCLIITAEKDKVSAISDQKKLASLFSNVELCIIPQYGHLLHYEAPVTVAMKIKDFLKGVEHHV